MSIQFHSPSHRAAGSDLSISVSPLGLIELSDEEFEVHGPRLNRYATGWAWFLGHHWSHRREQGEAQLSVNYVKAFAHFIANFSFGQGVNFRTPTATRAIVPSLLQRVWETDNHKESILWDMAIQGGVTGDSFAKVAYEEPWTDSVGMHHPGRVRILPLNSSHCFPEWHPHDRERLERFKLKYRFWATDNDGARKVHTYTEVLTSEIIEEYVNDERISSRQNPLGEIPVVHIPNVPVPGSPWGISDVNDILDLNREYNEKATDISDIISYHAAPVTVITGAKASQLERGPNKIWGGLPKDAQVTNLGLGGNLGEPMAYLEMLKQMMHEMTGVPETALGQRQPISNTSGVALAIQYQPMMQTWHLKKQQYGKGLSQINRLVLLTLAIKEPHVFQFDPSRTSELKDGEYPVLDLNDPITYRSTAHFPPPLPTDVLVKLNEIQSKMGLGIESKRGALRELGYEFPEEKMAEIFEELSDDARDQAALDLLRTHLMQTIAIATGTYVDEGDEVAHSGGNAGTAGEPASGPDETGQAAPVGGVLGEERMNEMLEELVVKAHLPRMSVRRDQSKRPKP